PPIFKKERQMAGVGIVTGLAWTALGGATLPIEVIDVHKKTPGMKLTGKLGDVMQESASIAYSHVRSHLKAYQGDASYFDDRFIHIHVPEGATPKDGPSAGVTISTALLSLVLGKEVDKSIAMTGEITLTGEVLPVGGIKEKIIAARRTGIKTIILPEGCTSDFKKLPEHIKEGIKFHFARKFREIVKIVFN
ncbi:MAG: endopeptidase La, partial [Desulfobacteraceae bacterium]|nr:endopeptidase La [Desulfobacteraceae bacterium]